MLKSVACLFCFTLLSILISPVCAVPNNYVYSINGKSGGEFIKGEITTDKIFDLDGVSVSLDSSCEIEKTLKLLNAKKVHYFTDGEIENHYFFSEKVHNFEIINGKKVNVHVAIKGDNLTVGSPIIYYGY